MSHTITRTEGHLEQIAGMTAFVTDHESSSLISRENADACVKSLIGEGFVLHALTGGVAHLDKPGIRVTFRITDYFDTSDWL